ncbi:hypothetical protein TWF718_004573 [Orbilia javanica]|uniref:Uncharacterized protein n=1 Tax=Orbilia javanica TaxID=47235 RepID=A0AAN8RL48_9PEZI
MHSPGLIATTVPAARGCILPVVRRTDHIWISDSLVRNAFHTFTPGRARCPRSSLAASTLTASKPPYLSRRFHKNRSVQTFHRPNNGDGASNHGSGSLFSWGSQLKGPPRFDYSKPSGVSPSVRTQHEDGIIRVLGSVNAKVEDENGSPWLFGPENDTLWKHPPSTKRGALVGFPPQVPYSAAKSPSGPWLSAPLDRLSELIEHDNLPPARALHSSSQRAAYVDLQVQAILRHVLSPSGELGSEPRKVYPNVTATPEEASKVIPHSNLQLILYSPKPSALVTSQIHPVLEDDEAGTRASQFLEFEESEESIDVVDTPAGTGVEVPLAPAITPDTSLGHKKAVRDYQSTASPRTTEPAQYRDIKESTPTRAIEEFPLAADTIYTPMDFVREEPAKYTSKPIPTSAVESAPTTSIPFDFVKKIHWAGVNVPLQPPKILLPKGKRLDVSSIPELKDIQSELLKLAADKSTSLESRVLIYSQIDAIYGVENLPDPKSLLDVFIPALNSNAGTMVSDVKSWISIHKSISRLQQKESLPNNFLERHGLAKPPAINRKGYTEVLDNPFRNPDIPIHRAWAIAKARLQRRDKISASGLHFIPFATVRIFLEKIIKLLHSGDWNSVKGEAVMTGVDIFKYCFEAQRRYPFLLFLELARFLMAWKRHWTTKTFLDDTNKVDQAGAEPDTKLEQTIGNCSLPDIPGLDTFFRVLPREYVDRLVCTLMLHAVVHSNEPLSEAHYLRKIMPFSRKHPMADLMKVMYRDGGYLPFLKDPSLYEKRVALEGHYSTARFLQGYQDVDMISFHLRTWPAFHGVRYIDDKELLDQVQEAMEDIIGRIQARISRDSMDNRPRAPGISFAQAILSFFYLNLPTEGIIVGIFLSLAHSKKINELKSCLNILSHFEGKYNGQVKFKIPKQAASIALKCFREHHLPWALDLLMNYHNRHNKTFASVILEAADKYPKQAAIVFEEFLKPLHITSLWNPQISFKRPGGWPSKWFLKELATKYALSNHHYPTTATRRIIHLRYLYKKYGYGVSMHITRALVATAMIRTATHRLWAGPELKAAEDLFKHERLKYAIAVFMKDADRSPTYLAGLTRGEAEAKKKEFVEKCVKEVWEEIFKWKKYQFALATEKRNRTTGII